MRFRRLGLIRYGHFTDIGLEFPGRPADFHVIFGGNEAGKSTALAAVEDLLFGIPVHSPYGFLHDYQHMRIGGHVESRNDSLEVIRRKGNTNVLLASDGSPIEGGENALTRYVPVDRSTFTRMFCLDHGRLRAGGQELLDARDDTGQILFAAAAGVSGLRKRVEKLSSEAAEQWAPRKSNKRKFYIAKEKYDEARKDLREHLVSAEKWREKKNALENAKAAHASVNDRFRRLEIERNRQQRIRLVFHEVRKTQNLDREIANLGDVVWLPDDAAEKVRKAEEAGIRAEARITAIQKQKSDAEKILNEFSIDEDLVAREDDIRRLHERRIEVRNEQQDLPKRKAELNAEVISLLANAREFGWVESDAEALIEKLPARGDVAVLRLLLDKLGGIEADMRNSEQAYRESVDVTEQRTRELEQLPHPVEVTRLSRATEVVREQGDLGERVTAAEEVLKTAQERVDRRMDDLNPGGTSEASLATADIPLRAEIADFRERFRDQKLRSRDLSRSETETRQELERFEVDLRQMKQDENIVSRDVLISARSHRDRLWRKIDPRAESGLPDVIDGGLPSDLDHEDLPGSFEAAMKRADALADRIFDHAEAVARMVELARKIEKLKLVSNQIQDIRKSTDAEGRRLDEEWRATWRTLPFNPSSPDGMLEWCTARAHVLDAIAAREEARRNLGACRDNERKARELLLTELEATGVDVKEYGLETLAEIVRLCRQQCDRQEGTAQARSRIKDDLEDSRRDVARRERDLRGAKESLDTWQKKWVRALGNLGLPGSTEPEAANTFLEILDRMRESASRIHSLQHDRINKIEADLADFGRSVDDLTTEIAPDLKVLKPDTAVLELERRLDRARNDKKARDGRKAEIEALQEQIAEIRKEQQVSADSISPLMATAQVESREALKEATDLSDRKRLLEYDRRETVERLSKSSGGIPFEQLASECEGENIDEVVAREEEIKSELEDLRRQLTDKATLLAHASTEFEFVGGDDRVAVAAAKKEEAAAEMRDAADQYIRVRTAERLLRWAIDRYRREKQAPLLGRAGELFGIATLGSFESLRVEFDQQDRAVLAGARPGGERVVVSGMSDGTVDQLYMALRVAAVEDYLEQSDEMPFVADDLFINFDDERSAAGFRLLGELSKKTQVLFFTHHEHLVEIAQDALGASLNLITLESLAQQSGQAA